LKLYNNRTPPNAVITSSNLNGKELKMLLVIFTILDFLGKNNISTTLQYRLTGKYLLMLIIPTPSANGVECLINTMCLTSSEYKFLENYNIRTGINNVFMQLMPRDASGYPGLEFTWRRKNFYISVGAKF
jgi:Fe(3+) dicitrate transport protein